MSQGVSCAGCAPAYVAPSNPPLRAGRDPVPEYAAGCQAPGKRIKVNPQCVYVRYMTSENSCPMQLHIMLHIKLLCNSSTMLIVFFIIFNT